MLVAIDVAVVVYVEVNVVVVANVVAELVAVVGANEPSCSARDPPPAWAWGVRRVQWLDVSYCRTMFVHHCHNTDPVTFPHT